MTNSLHDTGLRHILNMNAILNSYVAGLKLFVHCMHSNSFYRPSKFNIAKNFYKRNHIHQKTPSPIEPKYG